MLTAYCAESHSPGSTSLLQRGKQQPSTGGNSSAQPFPLSVPDCIDAHVFVIAYIKYDQL